MEGWEEYYQRHNRYTTLCRTVYVGSQIYSEVGSAIRVLQALWHPYSDTHLGVLSSDSVFRYINLFFGIFGYCVACRYTEHIGDISSYILGSNGEKLLKMDGWNNIYTEVLSKNIGKAYRAYYAWKKKFRLLIHYDISSRYQSQFQRSLVELVHNGESGWLHANLCASVSFLSID